VFTHSARDLAQAPDLVIAPMSYNPLECADCTECERRGVEYRDPQIGDDAESLNGGETPKYRIAPSRLLKNPARNRMNLCHTYAVTFSPSQPSDF